MTRAEVEENRALLAGSFDRLQELDIKPTFGNMEILMQTMLDINKVYEWMEGVSVDDGREKPCPERRDDDQ